MRCSAAVNFARSDVNSSATWPDVALSVIPVGGVAVTTQQIIEIDIVDLAITTASDATFGYQLAGRLESLRALTSDPQLGRA